MSKYLHDVLSEPAELIGSLNYTLGPGRSALDQAANCLRQAREIFITGIGSSWHAGMAVQSLFVSRGKFVHLMDASELLHFASLPAGAALIVLSRSGKSVEVVKLLDKAAEAKVSVIGVTNTPDSPLAQRPGCFAAPRGFRSQRLGNHVLSPYPGRRPAGSESERVAQHRIAPHAGRRAPGDTEPSGGMAATNAGFILVRFGIAHLFSGARTQPGQLLRCAAALGRRSPAAGVCDDHRWISPWAAGDDSQWRARIGLWLDPQTLRNEDLLLVTDLTRRGVKVMLLAQEAPVNVAELTLSLPSLPVKYKEWQFLADIIPAQLAAQRFAEERNADPDRFAICPYVITSEGGLSTPPPSDPSIVNTPFDFFAAADLCVDIIVRGNTRPQFSQVEQLVDDYDIELGGSATICAGQFVNLGGSAAIIGVVGDDLLGQFVQRRLAELNSATRHLRVYSRINTGVGFDLVERDDRAILTYAGSIDALTPADWSKPLLGIARHWHVASYFLLTRLRKRVAGVARRTAKKRRDPIARH